MNNVFLTVDLGFGDAGKGSIVDGLTREYGAHTVVRYNGGAQAAHRVVTDDGHEHVFSQFGSGTLAGAETFLSRFMLIDPLAMAAEAEHLRALGIADAFARTSIDSAALLITPFQRAINRLRELARGDLRHGSCGMGIGETMADALEHGAQVLRAGDLLVIDIIWKKLRFLRAVNRAKLAEFQAQLPDDPIVARELEPLEDAGWLDWLVEEYHELARRSRIVPGSELRAILARPGNVIFEGAQGVLLDEWYGFHPHTTWSTTTLANADHLLAEAGYSGALERIGISRAYATRHGAGPFVSEDPALTRALPDARNGEHPWQQGFRVGWLDLVLLRYALAVAGPLDSLALTCLDRLADLPELYLCSAYDCNGERIEQLPAPTRPDLAQQARLTSLLGRCRPLLERQDHGLQLAARISRELALPMGIISMGPTAGGKEYARKQSAVVAIDEQHRDVLSALR
jgi:adenylosuccinate synthase